MSIEPKQMQDRINNLLFLLGKKEEYITLITMQHQAQIQELNQKLMNLSSELEKMRQEKDKKPDK
jgi:hypothetical protein